MHISPLFYSSLIVLLSVASSQCMQSSLFSFDMSPQIPASERNYLLALHALKEKNIDHALDFLDQSKHEAIREITGQTSMSRLRVSRPQVGAALSKSTEQCTSQEHQDENVTSSPSIREWMRRAENQAPDKAIVEIAALAEAIVTKMAPPQEETVSLDVPEDRSDIVRVPKNTLVQDGRIDIKTARKLQYYVTQITSLNEIAARKTHSDAGDQSSIDRVEYNTRTKKIHVIIKDSKRDEEIVVYGDMNKSIEKHIVHMAYNMSVGSNIQYKTRQDNQDHHFSTMLDYVIQLLGIDTFEHRTKRSPDQKFLYAPIKRRFLKNNETIKCIAEYAYVEPSAHNGKIKPMIYHRLLRRRPNKDTNPQFKAWLLSK